MTELTTEQALDLGYECMKLHKAPHVYLWVGANDWRGGFEVVAAAHEPGSVAVSIKRYEPMILDYDGVSWS